MRCEVAGVCVRPHGKLLLRRAVVSEDAGSPDCSPGSGWASGPRSPATSVVETRSEKSGDGHRDEQVC